MLCASSMRVNLPYKLKMQNLLGNFLMENEILIDPHGLNMLTSVKKDGNVYFGERLYDVFYYYLLDFYLIKI